MRALPARWLPSSSRSARRLTPRPPVKNNGILAYRGEDDTQKRIFWANRHLHRAIARRAPASEFFKRGIDHVTQLPKAAAEEWRRIEAFLNTALYHYNVKVGETEVVRETELPTPKN